MDLTQINLFKALNARMHWLNQRQQVLAQNVANADTPGYQARDVEPLDFKALLDKAAQPLRMKVTDPAHQAGADRLSAVHISERKQKEESSPTGNSVSLEEEMMKVADTTQTYDLMTNLLDKSVGMLRIAMSRPHG